MVSAPPVVLIAGSTLAVVERHGRGWCVLNVDALGFREYECSAGAGAGAGEWWHW